MQFVRRYPGTAPPHPRIGETANPIARPAIEAISDRHGRDGARHPTARPAPEAISDPQGRDGQVEAEPSHHPIPARPAFEASQ
ncbi:hypothetical protein MTP02_24000 [Streptomyces albus]|nr:hypothetical protein MTP02_24000 [Streptomyces albus]